MGTRHDADGSLYRAEYFMSTHVSKPMAVVVVVVRVVQFNSLIVSALSSGFMLNFWRAQKPDTNC